MSLSRNNQFPDFPPVVVKTDRFDSVGMLFLDTDRFIILINNVRESADYGPLRPFRDGHLVPECDVTIFPKGIVREISKIDVAHD